MALVACASGNSFRIIIFPGSAVCEDQNGPSENVHSLVILLVEDGRVAERDRQKSVNHYLYIIVKRC
jgi:hypothetical protein